MYLSNDVLDILAMGNSKTVAIQIQKRMEDKAIHSKLTMNWGERVKSLSFKYKDWSSDH